jgi:hypothetical protein
MPEAGLNAIVPRNMIDLKGADDGSQNVLYEDGFIRTPAGYTKIDLTGTGLNSGEQVIGVLQYQEVDGTSHLIAVTKSKIFENNRNLGQWDDLTGTALTNDGLEPLSFAQVVHDDTDVFLNDDPTSSVQFQHIIICDGGKSNIQRWAGKFETNFLDLAGGDGYQTSNTAQRALQVGVFKSRLLLIAPFEWDNATGIYVANPTRVRWPQVGKLESWSGTGSGFADLVDTGDTNVWSAQVADQYTIYQKHSIWNLNHVGGTDVFDPDIVFPDLGLLSHRLIVTKNNVHYFVGDDFNVYAYYGGTVKQRIGDNVHRFLQRDIDPTQAKASFMTLDEKNKRLWIFITQSGDTAALKGYGLSLVNNSWTVRDFEHAFSSGGMTAANLIGADEFVSGNTYNQVLSQTSPNQADFSKNTVGDVTMRYGDKLLDNSRTLTKDYSSGSWSAGGIDYSKAAEEFRAERPICLTAHTTIL